MTNRRTVWLFVLVLFLIVAGVDTLAGKGGGKKPPPDEPPPDPAIVCITVDWPDSELTVMNEDGSNRTDLLTGTEPDSQLWTPCWSPDGTQLAFSYDDGVNGLGIYTLDVVVADGSVSGTNLQKIAPWSPDQNNLNPSWSPVTVFGEYRIAFAAADESGGSESTIHLVNADGSGDVTNLGVRARDISWSPSGDCIAATWRYRAVKIYDLAQDAEGNIYVSRARRYDVAAAGISVYHVGWAKTLDDTLALQVYDPDVGSSDIWIVDLDDGVFDPDAAPAEVDVFILDEHINLTPTARGSEGYPSWSPDDSRILYGLAVSRGSTEGYYTVAVDGSAEPDRITSSKDGARCADWRR